MPDRWKTASSFLRFASSRFLSLLPPSQTQGTQQLISFQCVIKSQGLRQRLDVLPLLLRTLVPYTSDLISAFRALSRRAVHATHSACMCRVFSSGSVLCEFAISLTSAYFWTITYNILGATAEVACRLTHVHVIET